MLSCTPKWLILSKHQAVLDEKKLNLLLKLELTLGTTVMGQNEH